MEQSILNNKTMTEILTKVTFPIVKLIQENKMTKEEIPILKERLIKSKYHSHHNNLYLESRNENCYELIR